MLIMLTPPVYRLVVFKIDYHLRTKCKSFVTNVYFWAFKVFDIFKVFIQSKKTEE